MKRRLRSMFIVVLIFVAVTLSAVYIIARTFLIFFTVNPWFIKALAMILLLMELFGTIHSTGYFINIMTILRQKRERKRPQLVRGQLPSVAILIPSYKEPISILRDTLVCCYNLTYPKVEVYLLDDSPYDRPWDEAAKIEQYRRSLEELCEFMGVSLFRHRWRGAKAGMINDFLQFLDGQPPPGIEFFPANNHERNPRYIVIFDADMNPFPNFMEPLVALMEADSKLAFVQTPQYYSNFESNRVANAAGFQQLIFFEFICEAKGLSDTLFCCGTNVVLRRDALRSVGGFDERSVTEDIATSFKMHMKGWKSAYYNEVTAFGMGPEDLNGYFKQQFRWALGTLTLGKTFIFALPYYLVRAPSFRICWEYFLSYTHYFIGWKHFIMMIFPMFFLFFNLNVYIVDPIFYIAIFFPYFMFSLYFVIWTLLQRKHALQGVINGLFLLAPLTFPVYMKAATYALFNIKGSFVVTPKVKGEILSLRDLWPQIAAMGLCIIAITWGVERIYYEGHPLFGLITNVIWCLYNFLMLLTLFYFNDSE